MMLKSPILGVLVVLIGGCAQGQSTCTARTLESALPPGWAVQVNTQSNPPQSLEPTSRYRLARIVVDPELHRRWAFIANCAHPEWPLQVVAIASGLAPRTVHAATTATPSTAPAASISAARTPQHPTVPRPTVLPQSSTPTHVARSSAQLSTPISSQGAPLVRAGDLVHLWSSDRSVHLDIEVVSLEYGRAGQVIRLRRLGQSALLAGVVVGKDSAELIP